MAFADPTQPTIVHPTVDDVPEIFSMIKELAEYEGVSHKVEATEQSLKRTLSFTGTGHHNPGYAKTMLMRLPVKPSVSTDKPEAIAGFALYFHTYSTWRSKPGIYIEDLYIREPYRRRGYRKMLLQELAREVLRIDGGRLEWRCLTWNEPSLDFYRRIGAREMKEWVRLRVDKNALAKLALGQTKAIQHEGQQNIQTHT